MYICIHMYGNHIYCTFKLLDMETAFEEGIKAAYDEVIYICIYIQYIYIYIYDCVCICAYIMHGTHMLH